jgi:hypothetical protein
MKEFKIAFWTPGTGILQNQHLFGCASHGFATDSAWFEPEKGEYSFWKETIKGTVFSGGYKNVLTSLSKCDFMPKVCIAFFRKSLGVEQFILKFRELLPDVPLIGGGAAIGKWQNMGDISPLAEEIVLLAADEGEFDLQTLNIYNQSNEELEINKTSDRSFNKVRLLPDGKWQSALDFFHEQKEIRGISQDDFESITFHDLNRRNIHCSIKEDQIFTGANLPDNRRLVLCVVDRKEATRHLSEFISEERSLVIGCAGIRSLIQKPLTAGRNSLAGFLFGEVVSLNHQPMFGNLMLARLTRK